MIILESKVFMREQDRQKLTETLRKEIQEPFVILPDSLCVSKRNTGRWMRTEAYPHRIYCSECYKTFILNDELAAWQNGDLPRNFCPNCGTPMKGDA